jgi:hypothetical protein
MKKLLFILLISSASCQLTVCQEDLEVQEVALQEEGASDDSFAALYDPFDEYADDDNIEADGAYEIQESIIPPVLRSLGLSIVFALYDAQDYCAAQYQKIKEQLAVLLAYVIAHDK